MRYKAKGRTGRLIDGDPRIANDPGVAVTARVIAVAAEVIDALAKA